MNTERTLTPTRPRAFASGLTLTFARPIPAQPTQAGLSECIHFCKDLRIRHGQVVTAPRSPWQNPFVERIIGSIRREASTTSSSSTSAICEECCHRFFNYYHKSRTHLSLDKDYPGDQTDASTNRRQDHCLLGGRWYASSLRTTRRITSSDRTEHGGDLR